jgi:hypothetical protein
MIEKVGAYVKKQFPKLRKQYDFLSGTTLIMSDLMKLMGEAAEPSFFSYADEMLGDDAVWP